MELSKGLYPASAYVCTNVTFLEQREREPKRYTISKQQKQKRDINANIVNLVPINKLLIFF